MNVTQRDESVAIDTVYLDTPDIDNDCKHAQISVGTKTMCIYVYGMKTNKQFVSTLEDCIRDRGATS